MTIGGVGGGNVMSVDVGAVQNEAARQGGSNFVAGENGRPEPVDHLRRQMIEAGILKVDTQKGSMLSRFKAMIGRFLPRITPFSSKAPTTTQNTRAQASETENAQIDRDPKLARRGVNGVTQGQLGLNIDLIDKMTPGNEKLPQNIKIMMGLSPTLMAHLQKYERAGCEFDIVPNTPENKILMDQKGFGDIALPKDFMGLKPREFVSALAETLIKEEVSNLHPKPMFEEGIYNKDDLIDLGPAMVDPYGIRASVKARAEIDHEGMQMVNEHHVWPLAREELNNVFTRHHELTEPTMLPPKIRKDVV